MYITFKYVGGTYKKVNSIQFEAIAVVERNSELIINLTLFRTSENLVHKRSVKPSFFIKKHIS